MTIQEKIYEAADRFAMFDAKDDTERGRRHRLAVAVAVAVLREVYKDYPAQLALKLAEFSPSPREEKP